MSVEMYKQGEYLERNPTWHVEDSPWKSKQIIKVMQKNNLTPKTICEVGCGGGEILNQLYLNLPNEILFHGYEISPQAFDLCKQRKKDRLQYHLKDILQDEKAFFDIILVIDVIEHIEDYFSFLSNIRQKGQYKIFQIPLDLSVQSVLRSSPILLQRENVGHINYFTKETALATLKDSGYEILDYFYAYGLIDLPPKGLKSLLARLPIKIMYNLNKDATVRIFGNSSLIVLTK